MSAAPLRNWRTTLRRVLLRGALPALCLTVPVIGARLFVDRAVAGYAAELEADLRKETMLQAEVHAQLARRLFDHATALHALSMEAFHRAAQGDASRAADIRRIISSMTSGERAGVFQVGTIDADGQLSWSSTGFAGSVDYSDREPFRLHAAGRQTAFVQTRIMGRLSGRPTIHLTHPILDSAGQFLGISSVSLDPDAVSRDLAMIPRHHAGRIRLVRDDGLVLASGDAAHGLADERLTDENLRRIVEASEGSAVLTGAQIGQRRITAWKQIEGWPVFLVDSLPDDLAFTMAQARGQAEWVMLVSAIVAFWGVALATVMWTREVKFRQLARNANLVRIETAEALAALPGAAYRVEVGPSGQVDWQPAKGAVANILGEMPGPDCAANPFARLIDADGQAARAQFIDRLMAGGEAIAEYNIRQPGSRLRRVREHARILTKKTDPAKKIVGMLTDVTAQRDLEAQLLTSARMANLGDMATGLAHEINQPATAIALAADLALIDLERGEDASTARQREILEGIVQQAVRLRGVISHFRAFSKPDDQSRPLTLERFDLALDGARRIIDGILNVSGVHLSVSLPDDLPPIQCRVIALEQILVNLIANARDSILSTPDAPRRIEISAKVNADTASVVVLVRDYASGFPPDVLLHAFDPFFTTKGPENGTGLGLSIVHTTMKTFGGTVSARNHPTGGAEIALAFKSTPLLNPVFSDQKNFQRFPT